MNQAEIKRRQAEQIAGILNLVTVFLIGNQMEKGGITYMSAAVYTCFLMGVLVSGGLSDALGKLLRSRRNRGQYRNILALRKSAFVFQGVLGLVGTAVTAVLAQAAAEGLFKIRYCVFVIIALSPAVLLRTISCVLQGYFQGEAAELPRAVSGILRQFFTLGFGFLFCSILGDYGEKISSLLRETNFTPMYRCLGAALAVCLAEVFTVLFLFILFKGSRRRESRMKQDGTYTGISSWDCIRGLSAGRWFRCCSEFLVGLPLLLGLALFGRKNQEEAGMLFQYDTYASRYLVVCGILVFLLCFLALPVTGKVFQYFRREEGRFARIVFQSGVHMGLVHGIFLSVFVAVMGTQISACLGGDSAELAGQMLRSGSSIIVLAALSLYFARFLQGMGKKYLLLCVLAFSAGAFLLLYFLTEKTGVLALVYGGVAAASVLCAALGVLAYRQMKIRMDWLGVLVLPLGAGGLAGLVCMLSGMLLTEALGAFPTVLVSFVLSGMVYWILLLMLRNFKEQELEILPGGRLMGKIGQILHRY